MGSRFYRHKTISRFSVGRFNFVNHIAEVKDADHDDFLREFEGLQGVDQVNIAEVLNIQNERPVQRVIKGSLDALNTVDSSNHMMRASDMRNDSKEQALRERQVALDARENELNELAARLEADQVARQAPVDDETVIGRTQNEAGDTTERETTLVAALGDNGPGEIDPNAPLPDLDSEPAEQQQEDKPTESQEAPGTEHEVKQQLPAGLRTFGIKPVDAVE